MTTSIGFDIYAKDAASAKFDALGNKIDGTSSKFSKIGQVAKVAGLAIVAGVGVASVALVGMTKAAIEDEAAQQKLAIGLKNATNATDAQVASAEKWITAQGEALGVTDDELRPALQKLAQSTGDVGKAQSQLQVAMDISAGSGKSLQSVTEAMMKANNGSIAGLGRLGIATKNAAGETLSMEQIMRKAGETFGGQAAANADTLGGKMDILRLRFDEAKETIGAKLIPVLTNLADWVLGTGVPAVEKFIQGWKDGEGAAGRIAAAFGMVGRNLGTIAPVLGVVAAGMMAYRVASLAAAAAAAVQAAGTTAATGATWSLNTALRANPIGLVVTALTLLGAGLVIAWKKSETFRGVVTGAWSAIRNATSNAFDAVRDKVSGVINAVAGIFRGFNGPEIIGQKWAAIRERTAAAWEAVRDIIGNKIDAARDAVANKADAIREKIVGAWDAARDRTADIWGALSQVVGDKIENVMEKVGSIKDRVLGKFTGAADWLVSAGASVVYGLGNGIYNTARDWLAGKVAAVADWIPAWIKKRLGIASPSKVAAKLGAFFTEGFAVGLSDTRPIDAAMRNLADHADLAGSGAITLGATSASGSSSVGGLGSGGGGVVLNVTINGGGDPNAVVAALHQYVKRNGLIRNVAAA